MNRALAAAAGRSVHAFRDDVLGTLDAVAVAERIARGEVSPREVAEAAIARARVVDPALNAIATEDYERGLARAARPPSGRLAGVPTFIKDTDPVAGLPTRFGSCAMPTRPERKTSAFVRQLESTGLIPLGKTTTPEFGLTATTEARVYGGATRNPWNIGHSTGGSSGGSSALVAAGVVPIAHANDGGGSIRIPAACCGLVGMKTTQRRMVAVEGSGLLPVQIVHQGVVTRSVRDTAVFYGAAERHDRRVALPAMGIVERPSDRRLRIGLYTSTPDGTPIDPECADAAVRAAALCEDLGHTVEEIPSPVGLEFLADFFVLWSMMAWALTRAGGVLLARGFDRSQIDAFTAGMANEFPKQLRSVPGSIRRLRRFAGEDYAALFRRHDVLLSPTLAMPPPPLGALSPDVPFETAFERLRCLVPFTPVHNVAGAPAISLPLARSRDGLPIGIHFAADVGDDRTLLELAYALEEAAPWPRIE